MKEFYVTFYHVGELKVTAENEKDAREKAVIRAKQEFKRLDELDPISEEDIAAVEVE